MKQISVALNMVFLSVFLFFVSSGQKVQNQNSILKDKISKLIQENKMLKLRIQNQCPPCIDCKNSSFKGISAKTAIQIARTYNTSANQNHFDSTRSVWFSLDTLKAFICAIEKANSNSDCKKIQLGIRIYYGMYPDSATMDTTADLEDLPRGQPFGYENRHTVFMVPTYRDNSKKGFLSVINQDFEPLYQIKNCEPLTFSAILSMIESSKSQPLNMKFFGKDIFSSYGANLDFPLTDSTTFTIMSANAEAKNHGDLIPPGTKTGADFLVPTRQ